MRRQEALQRVLFLKELAPGPIAELAAAGYERDLVVQEDLFREGDRSLGLIVVLAGAVRVYKADTSGREFILGVERAGASVADLPLFDGGTYPAGAVAAESDTRVYIVPRDTFVEFLRRYPEIAVGAVRSLAIQQRKLIEMLKAQALHTVRSRLAAYLLNTAEDSRTFPLRETNAAIGSHVGTVREVVSRTLRALEDTGAVHLKGRTVTLLDREKLRRIAESGD